MSSYFWTSILGWVSVVLIGIDILLPYLLRRSPLSKSLGISESYSRPYLERMWPHYWVGYFLVLLSIGHTWIPMQAGHMKRANATGLWVATIALLLLLVQALVGFYLQSASPIERKQIRSFHFWTMVVVAITVAVHIQLNG